MATRKKKVSAETVTEIEPTTAHQLHTVVTRYEKQIPIDDAEAIGDPTLDDDSEDLTFDDPIQELDEVESFLEQHGIRSDSEFTWSMVVERLPDYDRNRRNDVGARRKSCGERPFTPGFEEDIRREFARPGLANDFRVTIKRNGKFFRNWPHVISLEPPPPAVIMEEETRRNGAPAMPMPGMVYPAPAPAAVTMKQLIDQARQFAELQKYLLPGGIQSTAPRIDDEDFALLQVLKMSPEMGQKLASKFLGKLFNGNDHAADTSWQKVAELALENGPAILESILGILRGQAPAPGQAAIAPAAGPSESSTQALSSIVAFAHAGMTPDYVCDWLIDRSEGDEQLSMLIDSMAGMEPPTLANMMAQIRPDLKSFILSEQMKAFITGLIEYLNTTDEPEQEATAS